MTGRMNHLQRDLLALREAILGLGGLVEKALEQASTSLVEKRTDLARQVLEEDERIDQCELAIDDDCLKILALHQPVAGDLRLITASMKINNDLERIGDLAVNIAERALDLANHPPLPVPLRFERMTEATRWMLQSSLNALVSGDADLARKVRIRDDEVDDLNREHFETLIARMRNEPEDVEVCLDYLTSSLNLERVADLATNIAEDVIFLVESEDVRHRAIRKKD